MTPFELYIAKYTGKTEAAVHRKIRAAMAKGWQLVSQPEIKHDFAVPTNKLRIPGPNPMHYVAEVWFQRPKRVSKPKKRRKRQ